MILEKQIPQDVNASTIRSLSFLIFCIAQSSELTDSIVKFDSRNFFLSESYNLLNDAHDLIKLGYYKQAFASLIMAYDCGLYSIYYSDADGSNFERIFHSKVNNPYINYKFWNKIINMNSLLFTFNNEHEKLENLIILPN